jgi:hypothetical protein
MVNNNLNSSNPPPGANVQYQGTDRLGNNSMLMPGVNQYTGTQLNPGPFNIQCTGNQSGGSKEKKQNNDCECVYRIDGKCSYIDKDTGEFCGSGACACPCTNDSGCSCIEHFDGESHCYPCNLGDGGDSIQHTCCTSKNNKTTKQDYAGSSEAQEGKSQENDSQSGGSSYELPYGGSPGMFYSTQYGSSYELPFGGSPGMFYSKISCPESGKVVSIFSKTGQTVLSNYINMV